MRGLLRLRDETAPPGIVVVRLGAVTLHDSHLQRSAAECHERWGLWGFSVLEVVDGDFYALALVRPILAERRQVSVAFGSDLMDDGFALIPTLDAPHWTVVLPGGSPDVFERVRRHFRGPVPNPASRR